MRGPTCIFWASLTPSSLEATLLLLGHLLPADEAPTRGGAPDESKGAPAPLAGAHRAFGRIGAALPKKIRVFQPARALSTWPR
jgi:hypothetical protein